MPDEAIRHLAAGQFPALEALQIGWAENEWDADAIKPHDPSTSQLAHTAATQTAPAIGSHHIIRKPRRGLRQMLGAAVSRGLSNIESLHDRLMPVDVHRQSTELRTEVTGPQVSTHHPTIFRCSRDKPHAQFLHRAILRQPLEVDQRVA